MSSASASVDSSSYDYYAVFGIHGVQVGHDTQITGNVGAVFDRTESPSPHESVNMAGGADIIGGEVRAGQAFTMANETSVDKDVWWVTSITTQATSTIGGVIHHANSAAEESLPTGGVPSQWPDAATYCATDHSNTPGSHGDVSFAGQPNGHEIDLTPGIWGAVDAGSNTTLKFNGAGDYFLDELDLGSVSITYPAGVRLFGCDHIEFGSITSTPTESIYTEVNGTDNENALRISGGDWNGDMIVPNGSIHYGAGGSVGTIKGHMWAKWVDLEHGLHISAPQESTTTTTSTSTTIPTTTAPTTDTTSTSTSSTSTSTTTPSTVPDSSTSTSTTSTSTSSTSTSTSTSTSSSTSTSTSTTIPETTTSLQQQGSTTTTSSSTTSTTVESSSSTIPSSTSTITEAGSTVAQSSTTTTTPVHAQGSTTLPFTGGGTGLIPPALVALAAGIGLVAAARRRKVVP
jgi:hypothetical protein